MATRKHPVRGPRATYKIAGITVNLDDNKTGTDAGAGTTRPIFVKMKEPIGDFLGLAVVPWNDPALSGTFGGTGANKGAKYQKRLGGFREASYTLVAKTKFTIGEIVRDADGFKTIQSDYAQISIGFPKGHSVNEFIKWIMGTKRAGEIRAIITPSGARHVLGAATP